MTDERPMIGRRSRVTMHFELGIAGGPVADSTFDDDPITFRMGDGTLVEGLEMALLGLHEGEEHAVEIEPALAFGYRDPGNVHDLPRKDFPADIEPEPGLVIDFATPTGDSVPGTVVEVGEGVVKVDFSHPLAGHEVAFRVKILEIENPADEAGSEKPEG